MVYVKIKIFIYSLKCIISLKSSLFSTMIEAVFTRSLGSLIPFYIALLRNLFHESSIDNIDCLFLSNPEIHARIAQGRF